ncbi:hypothetical protein C5C74_08020 [Rathayibacter sp. AY1E8]|nr:hypothetical protein C5C74_08020 [Rathayibacter sp. AY1E8]PPH83530.1 hypothetical protein C5C82_15575 [Rathayibacter sp. AY1D5]PPI07045.1 hypothetical protein C5D04_16895 [Rathayibacter sp. AY1D2]
MVRDGNSGGGTLPMSVRQSPRPDHAIPLVFAVIFTVFAAALGLMSSLYMWDPAEACEVRGSYSSSESFLWNPLCVDGSAVQPLWMTVAGAAALIGAGVCVVLAIAFRVLNHEREVPPPVVSHWE